MQQTTVNPATRFVPHPWLRNPHAQTLFSAFFRPRPRLPLREEPLELPDGDVLRLIWGPPAPGPLVAILHGLGGHSTSRYVLAMMKALRDRGIESVVMEFRGAGGWRNRLDRFYHAAATEDLEATVRALRERRPGRPLGLVGYSLGASVALNWLGEKGERAPVDAAAVVSPPFDLHACARHIDRGFARLYQWELLRALKRMVRRKYAHRADAPVDLRMLAHARSLYDFDDRLTAPLHGFGTAANYYAKASCGQRLGAIRRPTLIVHAEDDPFIPAASIPPPDRLPSQVTLERHRAGGHVGFVAPAALGGTAWLEHRLTHFMSIVMGAPHHGTRVSA